MKVIGKIGVMAKIMVFAKAHKDIIENKTKLLAAKYSRRRTSRTKTI